MDRKALLPLLGMVLAFAAWLFDFGQQQGGVMAGGDPVLGTLIQWVAVTVFAGTALLWIGVAVREVQSWREPRFSRGLEKVSYRRYQQTPSRFNLSPNVFRADLKLRVKRAMALSGARVRSTASLYTARVDISPIDHWSSQWFLDLDGTPDADVAELQAKSIIALEPGYIVRVSLESHQPIGIDSFKIRRVRRPTASPPTTAPAQSPPSSPESS